MIPTRDGECNYISIRWISTDKDEPNRFEWTNANFPSNLVHSTNSCCCSFPHTICGKSESTQALGRLVLIAKRGNNSNGCLFLHVTHCHEFGSQRWAEHNTSHTARNTQNHPTFMLWCFDIRTVGNSRPFSSDLNVAQRIRYYFTLARQQTTQPLITRIQIFKGPVLWIVCEQEHYVLLAQNSTVPSTNGNRTKRG